MYRILSRKELTPLYQNIDRLKIISYLSDEQFCVKKCRRLATEILSILKIPYSQEGEIQKGNYSLEIQHPSGVHLSFKKDRSISIEIQGLYFTVEQSKGWENTKELVQWLNSKAGLWHFSGIDLARDYTGFEPVEVFPMANKSNRSPWNIQGQIVFGDYDSIYYRKTNWTLKVYKKILEEEKNNSLSGSIKKKILALFYGEATQITRIELVLKSHACKYATFLLLKNPQISLADFMASVITEWAMSKRNGKWFPKKTIRLHQSTKNKSKWKEEPNFKQLFHRESTGTTETVSWKDLAAINKREIVFTDTSSRLQVLLNKVAQAIYENRSDLKTIELLIKEELAMLLKGIKRSQKEKFLSTLNEYKGKSTRPASRKSEQD